MTSEEEEFMEWVRQRYEKHDPPSFLECFRKGIEKARSLELESAAFEAGYEQGELSASEKSEKEKPVYSLMMDGMNHCLCAKCECNSAYTCSHVGCKCCHRIHFPKARK
jgi:hypothetical protein